MITVPLVFFNGDYVDITQSLVFCSVLSIIVCLLSVFVQTYSACH